MIRTWSSAVTVAPIALPRTMPVRPIGATRISRRNPNSRSQTTDTPAKSELVSTDWATMPGYMKAMKSTPGASDPMIWPNPAPKITRNISGNARLDTIRERSFTKRSSSR